MRAENTIELAGEDAARMQKLLDVLEDLDDVQDVYPQRRARRMTHANSSAEPHESPRHRRRRPRTRAGLEAGAVAERVQAVYVAPGNGGTARDPRLRNVPITDLDGAAPTARSPRRSR